MDAVTNGKRGGGLSGSTLKLIAVAAMLVDHTGAALLGRMILTGVYRITSAGPVPVADPAALYRVYQCMRGVGRLAFPIYCFLLVEGFLRTGNARKYAARLGLFALVSEVPFDLAFKARSLEFHYQNVFFTLLLGLTALMALDWARSLEGFPNRIWQRGIRLAVSVAAVFVCCLAAHFLHTDYGARGILCIVILYLTCWNRRFQTLAGAAVFLWEIPAPAAFIPIAFYNGRRGLRLRYVFYAFYPVHLLLLYLVSFFLGFSQTAVFP